MAWSPHYLYHTLADAIAEPMEAHIDSFGSGYFQRIIGETNCRVIIDLKSSRASLGMTKSVRYCPKPNNLSSVFVTRGIFYFCS